MEKLDIRSAIVLAEDVFLSIQNAKQTILQGLEVHADRKLQGGLVKSEDLLKRLHMLDRQANPNDYKDECIEKGNDELVTADSKGTVRPD